MILVTGASGKLGRSVVEHLVSRVSPSRVVAAVRTPEKAADLAKLGVTVRKLDYDDPESVDAAFAGVTKAVLVSSNDFAKRRAHHETVIAAAERANLALLAYTGILHSETTKLALAADHQWTETRLRASRVPFVFLRNGWYIENYTDNVEGTLASGVLLGAAGEGKLSPAARSDLAEAAAVVLTTEGHAGKAYELAGDTAYGLADIAAAIGKASGKTIAYRSLPAAEYAATLESFGVPAGFAGLLADSDVGIERGDLRDDGKALSKLIGHPTAALDVTVAAALRAR
jgi:NAD(P)H dehydrogenase (quinone)